MKIECNCGYKVELLGKTNKLKIRKFLREQIIYTKLLRMDCCTKTLEKRLKEVKDDR